MVLILREHDVEDYSTLPDMDSTDVGVLFDDDQKCLDELGQYLVDSDVGQRFAVWLLHKHFDPTRDEVMVERTLRTPRGTETALVKRSAIADRSLNAIAIRFDADVNARTGVVAMEFASTKDLGVTAPIDDRDAMVFAGVAERLRAHRKEDRFGLRLIHNPLNLAKGELMLETSNRASRILRCEVRHRHDLTTGDVIATAWHYQRAHTDPKSTALQNCVAGCIRVGEGHDLGHDSTVQDDSGDF